MPMELSVQGRCGIYLKITTHRQAHHLSCVDPSPNHPERITHLEILQGTHRCLGWTTRKDEEKKKTKRGIWPVVWRNHPCISVIFRKVFSLLPP